MDTEKAFLLNQRFVLLDNDEKRIEFENCNKKTGTQNRAARFLFIIPTVSGLQADRQ